MTLSCSLVSTVKGCVLSVVILTNHIGLIPLIWFPEFNITIVTIVQMFVQGVFYCFDLLISKSCQTAFDGQKRANT